jgi:hypothetical protein
MGSFVAHYGNIFAVLHILCHLLYTKIDVYQNVKLSMCVVV